MFGLFTLQWTRWGRPHQSQALTLADALGKIERLVQMGVREWRLAPYREGDKDG